MMMTTETTRKTSPKTSRSARHRSTRAASNAPNSWIVVPFQSEYTPTGFLQDSSECLTMALVHHACLEPRDRAGYGRRCRSQSSRPRPRKAQNTRERDHRASERSVPGYPALQTAIWINESIPGGGGGAVVVETSNDKPPRKSLNATRLQKGCVFSLGNHGSTCCLRRRFGTNTSIDELEAGR